MNTYAYVRVSGVNQNEDRQLAAMEVLSIPETHIYIDKQSGRDFDRPAYQALMKRLEPGDLLFMLSLDRLGRNYEETLNQWRVLTKERGVDIAVINMPLLDTRLHKDLLGTFMSDVVLQILSFASANEANAIRERQESGIRAAQARGVCFGRPKKELPENFIELGKQWQNRKISTLEFMKRTGMAETTLYRRLGEHGIARDK